MKAALLFDEKTVLADGAIIQVRVWSVPVPVLPAIHSYKYSLFYGRPRERLVGFDNERGKGDHTHVLGTEAPYAFRGITRLLQDFRAAVEAVRGGTI